MTFFKATAAACAVFAASTVAASAATWTFGADAEGFQESEAGGFEGTFDQVYLDSDSDYFGDNVQDGITLTASAHDHDNPHISYDPFMDAFSNSMPAGLGVCSGEFDEFDNGYGGESTCSSQYDGDLDSDTSDDNLMFPEILKLTFSEEVYLHDLLMRNAAHGELDGVVAISTDGTHETLSILTVDGGNVLNLDTVGLSDTFYFTSVREGEIYLETLTVKPIPLPAAGWLLLGGLGGIAAMRRRKKA